MNGSKVAVTPCSETSREVEGIHGLRFNFTEDGLAHGLELPIDVRLAHLQSSTAHVMPQPCRVTVTLQKSQETALIPGLPFTASYFSPVNLKSARTTAELGEEIIGLSLTKHLGKQPVPNVDEILGDHKANLQGKVDSFYKV